MARPRGREDQLGLLQGTLDMLILQTLRRQRGPRMRPPDYHDHRADLVRRPAGGPGIAVSGNGNVVGEGRVDVIDGGPSAESGVRRSCGVEAGDGAAGDEAANVGPLADGIRAEG